MKRSSDPTGLKYALLGLLLVLSCSSNPSVHRLITPEALPTVNTKGDRVKMGKISSRVPEASKAGVVELLQDAMTDELRNRNLIWPYSVHTVSADIISYTYRSRDEINRGPIVWWALPALPLGIVLSPAWSVPFVCASGMSYVLDRATKVGAFSMTVNVKVHKREKEILSENVVVDLAERDIASERTLMEEMSERIADRVAAAIR